MTYATRQAFEASFSAAELTQLETGRSGAFDQTAKDADGEINSYLSTRYSVPVSPAPKRLIAVALDIARYRLYDDAAPEQVNDRYDRAVAWLRDIAAGRAALTDDAGTPIAPADEPTAGPVAPYTAGRRLTFGKKFEDRYRAPVCEFHS